MMTRMRRTLETMGGSATYSVKRLWDCKILEIRHLQILYSEQYTNEDCLANLGINEVIC